MAEQPDRFPPSSPIQALLQDVHARFAGVGDGRVASYIPELAKADPAAFGIAIATVDGQVYEVGRTNERFTIQSVSKPLVYGAALEDNGRERVQRAVGVEPSGEAFNSISLEPGTGRPMNPMINAGAIAVASLIRGDSAAARLERVVGALSAYAGRRLDIDEAVYESERDTGHRNRAIGHLLRNYGIVDGDPEPALDLYFRQCSLRVDCRDLALMAATLANAGVNPVSGERAVSAEYISSILSVMATCGIYDFTGEWVYRVGLPAKSGVGGGILAVLPGQLGIGVFSPPLDERGNSVRGVKVCEAISSELGLHFLQPPTAGVRVYELQGDLRFATVEPLLRDVVAAGDAVQCLVLDFQRVAHVDGAASRLLARLIEGCAANGRPVMLARVRRGALLAELGSEVAPRWARAYAFHAQLDLAIEACERELLARHGAGHAAPALDGLAQHRLCAGLGAADVDWLGTQLQRRSFGAGDAVVRRGDAADALFLLMRGEVSVVVPLPQGGHKRLATLSAGMVFGESAAFAGGQRSADVNADTEVECLTLAVERLAVIEAERPRVMARLLHNLLQVSAETISRLTAEVAALEG